MIVSINLIIPKSTLELREVSQDTVHHSEIWIIELSRGIDIEVTPDDFILERMLRLEEIVEVGSILITLTTLTLLKRSYISLLLTLDIQLAITQEVDLTLQGKFTECLERLRLNGVIDELNFGSTCEDSY